MLGCCLRPSINLPHCGKQPQPGSVPLPCPRIDSPHQQAAGSSNRLRCMPARLLCLPRQRRTRGHDATWPRMLRHWAASIAALHAPSRLPPGHRCLALPAPTLCKPGPREQTCAITFCKDRLARIALQPAMLAQPRQLAAWFSQGTPKGWVRMCSCRVPLMAQECRALRAASRRLPAPPPVLRCGDSPAAASTGGQHRGGGPGRHRQQSLRCCTLAPLRGDPCRSIILCSTRSSKAGTGRPSDSTPRVAPPWG